MTAPALRERMAAMGALKYSPELDGLRAVAVMLVVLTHAGVAEAGVIGVDLFFVLSGYLVTRILMGEQARTGRIDFCRFFIRRFRRIFPAAAVMILVFAPMVLLLDPPSIMKDRGFVIHILGVGDVVLGARLTGPLGHLWSIIVEMKFYLAWSLVLPFVLRAPNPALIAAVLWLAMTLTRMAFGQGELDYFLLRFHATGLVLGSALALWGRTEAPKWLGWAGLAVIVATLLIDMPWGVRLIPAEVATAMLVLSPPGFLAHGPLVWAGRFAYGTYLWNPPLVALLGDPQGWGSVPGVYAASVAVAAISYFTVERLLWKPSVGGKAKPQPGPGLRAKGEPTTAPMRRLS